MLALLQPAGFFEEYEIGHMQWLEWKEGKRVDINFQMETFLTK